MLLPPTFWLGFLVISLLLAVGLVQTMLTRTRPVAAAVVRRRPADPARGARGTPRAFTPSPAVREAPDQQP